jgi:rRNA pseudouridine-1189 N-methylase Emg1 (Nep1/Mra1 family)
MEPQFEGKSVPWLQMEEFLNLYQNKILPFITLKNSGVITISEVEARVPKHLFELYEVLTKILKDNKILPNEEDFKLNQL